ncbi:proteasome component Ecm29p [Trichomonascus vanleenenianus]|uniref:Ecm29p n=1 Tax=Trichomonascus vanleenenianus TaxID=2268995 RepID=UPI003ECAE6D4
MSSTPEATELSLVNKVELKLLLTKDEDKFAALIKVFLPPLLLKLNSPHKPVRDKVVEVCEHINQRLRSNSMELPIDALLAQYGDPKITGPYKSTLQSFDLIYVKKGLPALKGDKSRLLPLIVQALSSSFESIHNTATLFGIFLDLLKVWVPPERGTTSADELPQFFGFDMNPDTEEFISRKFTDIFAIDYNLPVVRASESSDVHKIDKILGIEGQTKPSGATISEAKNAALKMLLSGAFSEQNMYFPLLLASNDTNTNIKDKSSNIFLKLKIDLESPSAVAELYRLASRFTVNSASLAKILRIVSTSNLATSGGSDTSPVLFIDLGFSRFSNDASCMSSTIQLVREVLKNSTNIPDDYIKELLQRTENWIKGSGWPTLMSPDAKSKALRSKAYELMGTIIRQLASKGDTQSEATLYYIKLLFSALEQDSADIKPSVQDALSDILQVVPNMSAAQKEELKQLLMFYLIEPDQSKNAKFLAIRYAVRVAPFNDPTARMLCLIGLYHGNQSDIIEEAKRGLNPHWYRLVNSQYGTDQIRGIEKESPLPSFNSMIECIKSFELQMKAKHLGTSLSIYDPSVFSHTIQFLEEILIMEAAVKYNVRSLLVVDDQWESRITTAISMDSEARKAFRRYLLECSSNLIEDFLQYAFQGLGTIEKSSASIEHSVGICAVWLRIISQLPKETIERYASNTHVVDELISLLERNSQLNFQYLVAEALGILSTTDGISIEKISILLTNFIDKIENSRLTTESVQGELLALGFVVSRLQLRSRLSSLDNALTGRVVNKILTIVADEAISAGSFLLECAINSLTQLAIFGVLQRYLSDVGAAKTRLINLSKKFNNEKAILALGSLTQSDTGNRKWYIDQIMEISDSKHIEFMFASGEALTIAAYGWKSTVSDRYLDVQHIALPSDRGDELSNALNNALVHSTATKPSLRKFACMWLLSIVKYCGQASEVKSGLKAIHKAFMRLLSTPGSASTNDGIIQETASLGLGMIYELGDEDLKQDLVKGLVTSVAGESTVKVNAGSVSDDTELFEPGALGIGEGKSVSTYRDVLNLANEVGDPGLVYKFMSLASHSSLWSSRRGAAFGLSSVLSKANLIEVFEQNEKMTRSLIPKLFRYQFDPDSSVRESMKDIWNVLVPNKSATMNKFFDVILEDLLSNMTSREYRVRQASTAALTDLLQGCPMEKYADNLQDIWRMAFRIVDDIKESVRASGIKLTRSLINSLLRQVDVESGASEKRASALMEELVPFLLGNNGLQSDVEEVQSIALDTILKLCKKSSPRTLRPWLPQLCEELLGLLSTLEPQAMNYLALNADKYGLTSDAIDSSRMASLRNSPMMDAVERLVELINDKDTMDDFIPRLGRVIQRSVGLPSKLGASRVLVLLTIRKLHDSKPYADNLLAMAKSQLTNANETVAKSYALAAGYICRMANTAAVAKYEQCLEGIYFEDESDRTRGITGSAMDAVSKHSADMFSAMSAAFLPFIFIAKHDYEEYVREVFDAVWNNNTGGAGAVRLHIKEICKLASKHLSHQHWSIRQTVAQSVADAASSIQIETENDSLRQLFQVLIEACQGRSWKGKEQVFKAVVSLTIRAKDFVLNDQDLFGKINHLVQVEVKRRNKDYQTQVLQVFGKYVGAFPQRELYELEFELLAPYLHRGDEDEGEDEDGDANMNSPSQNVAKEELRVQLLGALLESLAPRYVSGKRSDIDTYSKAFAFLSEALKQEDITWRTKIGILNGVTTKLADVLKDSDRVQYKDVYLRLWKIIVEICGRDINHEKVRAQTARAGATFLTVADEKEAIVIREDLQSLRATEKSSVVQAELDRSLE